MPAGQEQMADIAGCDDEIIHANSDDMFRVGTKKAGRLLDGKSHDDLIWR